MPNNNSGERSRSSHRGGFSSRGAGSSSSFKRAPAGGAAARGRFGRSPARGSSHADGGVKTYGADTSSSAGGYGGASSFSAPRRASSRPYSGGAARSGGFTSSRGGSSAYGRSSDRGGYSGGGSRGGSSRSGGGGGRRRFSAPVIDIEHFIEKSKRETVAHKALEENTPQHVVKNDFASLIEHPKLRAQVAAKGYKTPTPIQDQAIPHVRLKKDIVGIANTGTGKTAAFLIPLIDRALVHPKERTLIVVPTRELATQIGDELRGFAVGLGIMGAVCIGGANIRAQIAQIERARFVIGTPGRLKDLIERRRLDMKSFSAIVLDEADRMLDMGFINDIRYLFAQMVHERHSLCFSATMSPEIQHLISEFLKDPINVSVKTGTTSHNVEQNVIRVTEGASKFTLLEELLRDPSLNKVLVFGETKHGVERLTKQLLARGIRAESIHGNKSSNQRQRSLIAFKDGRARVLVATDVAARGLDITDVSHVINYDVPHSYEDYVHRIGRTGRAGAKGKALTFVG